MDLQSRTDRLLIVTLALVGAVLATAASVLGHRQAVSAKRARILAWGGYVISFASVLLFIIAGFLR
jgi:hypothetical protein